MSNGRATTPPQNDFSDIVKLFPTTFDVSVSPPFLIIRVRELPQTTLPFTVSGLPIQLTTADHDEPFNKGVLATGSDILRELDLHRKLDYTHAILLQVIEAYHQFKIKISSIFWFGGFWQVSLPDEIDLKNLPFCAARCPVFYLEDSETPQPVPAALRTKAAKLDDYDDTIYASSGSDLLRPGVMLSSSLRTKTSDGKTEEGWETTTSGILVADAKGEFFVTVASHGFNQDGLVYHPNPKSGTEIGRVVRSLPHLDISLVRLHPGFRYVNHTFGNTTTDSQGTLLTGLSPCVPPHLRIYDLITTDNPFTGLCEGLTMAVGVRITDDPKATYVRHQWKIFENGSEPVDGACGCPILDDEGRVVGLFRFKAKDSGLCLSASLPQNCGRTGMKSAAESRLSNRCFWICGLYCTYVCRAVLYSEEAMEIGSSLTTRHK